MNDTKISDESLIIKMKTSTTIQEWNENREYCKQFRDSEWLIKNIEQSGLINEVFPYKGK